jgi:7-carboxy-7-deazaguanine synthase (Cx14CxxC type)
MSYAVKEIHYTLQGEGANAGRPAVFLRFTGCNLWSGRAEDRGKGPGACSAWCDTDFVGTDGPGGGKFESARALSLQVVSAWKGITDAGRLVVCTGGEPLLQLDEQLLAGLHAERFEVAVETNGTLIPPPGIDWICVSPKAGSDLVLDRGDEIKLVYPQPGAEPSRFEHMAFRYFFLQPLDDAALDANTEAATAYCLEHPRWRLSLQTHKLLGIP